MTHSEDLPSISLMLFSFIAGSSMIDLGFILGASGQNAETDFYLQKEIAKEIIKSYDISRETVRVGAMLYGQSANLVIRLNSIGDQTSALGAIDNLRPYTTGNNLERAFQLVSPYMFASRLGGRSDAAKVVVVFHNSPVQQRAFIAAKELLGKGYKLVSVGIGRNIRVVDGAKITGRKELALSAQSVPEARNVADLVADLVKPGTYLKLLLFISYTG